MPRYRIDLSYVGTDHWGWQSQTSGRGIQDIVEQALATVLRAKVRCIGASRTDSGVHAEGQVGCFKTEDPFDPDRLLVGVNALLPQSIGVTALYEVAETFHPIRDAHAKVYRYVVLRGRSRYPALVPFCWPVRYALDVDAMIAAAKYFEGKKDFSAVAAADSAGKSRVRNLMRIEIVESGPLLVFWFLGDGFLKQMVRNIVGTLIDVGRGRYSAEHCLTILANGLRQQAGETAPAPGLSLVNIFYEPPLTLDRLKESASFTFLLK